MNGRELERAQAFIASRSWVFARTMAHYNPHEYLVAARHGGPDFDAFVQLVRQAPIRCWRGGRYHCLTVDEHDYWLTHAGAAGWIVNRKPSERAGWDEQPPPTRDRREIIEHDVERWLISRERADELLRRLDEERS